MKPFEIEEIMQLAPVYFEPRINDERRVLAGTMNQTLARHGMWDGLYKYLGSIGFTDKSYEEMSDEQAAIEETLDEINTLARQYYINTFMRKKLQLQPDHEMMEIIMRLGYDPINEVERMLEMRPPVTREDVQKEFDKNYNRILEEAQNNRQCYGDKKTPLTEVKLVFTEA